MFSDATQKMVDQVAEVYAKVRELDHLLSDYISQKPDVSEAAEVLFRTHGLKREIATTHDVFSGKVGEFMDTSNEITLISGGTVEKKIGADRKKWHHPQLATRVAERLHEMSVDMDTGEVVMTAQDMVVKLLDYAAISYWRVGKLGEIGINPDQFCEQGDYKTNIIIREAK